LLTYFHEYAILLPNLHPNLSVLTVDRVNPLSVKRSGGDLCKAAGQGCRQRCRARLPCKVAGQVFLLLYSVITQKQLFEQEQEGQNLNLSSITSSRVKKE
jgi:hypothetical protein